MPSFSGSTESKLKRKDAVYFSDAVFFDVVRKSSLLTEFVFCMHQKSGSVFCDFDVDHRMSVEVIYQILNGWKNNRSNENKGCLLSVLRQCDPLGKSVPELAQLVGMSVSHFSRSCSSQLGVSPSKYVREVLFSKVRAMLIGEDDLSLVDVAMLCGFSDQPHLTRSFKARFGITPGAYQKKMINFLK